MPRGEDFKLNVLKWIEKNSIEGFNLETDSYLRDTYAEILKCYTDKNYTVNEKGTIKRLSYNNPVILDILYYIIENDKSLLKDLTVVEKQFLSRLEEKQKPRFNEIVEWFNIYGDNILDSVYKLSRSDKIPENLRSRIFDESLIGKYTPIQVCQEIEKSLTKQINYTITYNSDGYDKNIELAINLNEKSTVSERELDKIARTILLLPKFNINRIKDNKVEVNIYLSSAKKKCQSKNVKILGANNINSGVTVFKFSEMLPIITTVYRSEEMHKLLIHELVHNYRYDFEFMDFNLKISDFLNISRDTKLTPNESYTEIVTVILNTAVESYNFKDASNYDLFKVMLEYEAQFSLLQCARILKFYDFTSADDFFQKYDNRNRFKQNTNVFSYFFIKTALLVNTAELLDFFERYTNNLYLKKGNIYYIKSEFEKLIIKSLKRNQYQKGIDHFFKKISRGNGNGHGFSDPKELCKTLRMTIFG